jgi:hypothetical protein
MMAGRVIPPLLDLYPGAAAAYSLRKLRSAYSGSAIRVRRSSDNAEQDIGFVADNLDTASLASFCVGTNGLVTTWYDQSGNSRNATQTAAANQPQIVSSGSVILENGNPSVNFDGSNDFLSANSVASSFSGEDLPLSRILILKPDILSSAYFLGLGNSGSNFPARTLALLSSGQIETLYRDNSNVAKSSNYASYSATQMILHEYNSGAITNVFKNNVNILTNLDVNVGIITLNRFTIGALERIATLLYFNGNIQEIIAYASDQNINRTGIENNLNDFYSIY